MPPFDFTRLRTNHKPGEPGHADLHNDVNGALLSLGQRSDANAIYAADYPSLQAAVDAAVGGTPEAGVNAIRTRHKLLIIPPGVHVLTEPLKLYSLHYLHLFAYGAVLRSGAPDMPAMIDLCGCNRCTISGLSLDMPVNAVTRGLWLRTDFAVAQSRSSNNRFYDISITGKYTTGVEFGDGGTHQTDTSSVYGLVMNGQWNNATQTGNTNGVWIHGSGNITEHHFYGLSATGHRWNVNMESDCIIDGANFAGAEADFKSASVGFTKLSGIRSESSKRLWDASGGASFPINVSMRDVNWHANAVHDDGRIVVIQKGGIVNFSNVRITSAARAVSFHASPPKPLQIIADGVIVSATPSVSAVDFWNKTGDVNVDLCGYIQVEGGAIASAQLGRTTL